MSKVSVRLDEATIRRAYGAAKADRWNVPVEAFAAFLTASAARALADGPLDPSRLKRYVDSLHLEDLALACACAEGHGPAWDHFVASYRPVLYRAADAIDPSGRAREAADSLYAELFGLGVRDGERQSHFRYFHGRSTLATWLRAVLSQRYVDRVRADARLAPLPEDEAEMTVPAAAASSSPSAAVLTVIDLLRRVMTAVVASLPPRDRLRLRCYYTQDLTLAQIGRTLGEHEATVSRQLTRLRRLIRDEVARVLREQERMTDAAIAECFAAAVDDPGPLDLAELLGPEPDLSEGARKPARIVQSRER